MIDPILNMVLIKFNEDTDKQFWLLIGHMMFGIGCFIGPVFVYYFQLKVFLVLGLISVIVIVPYFMLKSP